MRVSWCNVKKKNRPTGKDKKEKKVNKTHMERLLSELKCIWVCMQISHPNRNLDWASLRHNYEVAKFVFHSLSFPLPGYFPSPPPFFFLSLLPDPSEPQLENQNCPGFSTHFRTLSYTTSFLLFLLPFKHMRCAPFLLALLVREKFQG